MVWWAPIAVLLAVGGSGAVTIPALRAVSNTMLSAQAES
jgi:hypothetical protein